jgi:hypothetical protein
MKVLAVSVAILLAVGVYSKEADDGKQPIKIIQSLKHKKIIFIQKN